MRSRTVLYLRSTFPSFGVACKIMRLLAATVTAALALVPSCNAVNLVVEASGGNASSPLMYGLMFEVSKAIQ